MEALGVIQKWRDSWGGQGFVTESCFTSEDPYKFSYKGAEVQKSEILLYVIAKWPLKPHKEAEEHYEECHFLKQDKLKPKLSSKSKFQTFAAPPKTQTKENLFWLTEIQPFTFHL